MVDDIERITDPADPRRCQAVIPSTGQCINVAVPGGTTCIVHGGNKQTESQAAKNIRNYQLAKWRTRLNQYTDSPAIKNLRDEVGILRMMMETTLERCSDDTELLLASQQISDLVMKIEKVVTSCTKLEANLGQTMDKQALLNFANRVIGIIGDNITDEKVLNNIADSIIRAIPDDAE